MKVMLEVEFKENQFKKFHGVVVGHYNIEGIMQASIYVCDSGLDHYPVLCETAFYAARNLWRKTCASLTIEDDYTRVSDE